MYDFAVVIFSVYDEAHRLHTHTHSFYFPPFDFTRRNVECGMQCEGRLFAKHMSDFIAA